MFGISTASLDALFRKARERSCIKGLAFHDNRHAAITQLAKKLNVLDLARMVGYRDLRMLQVYYNESAEDMAAKIGERIQHLDYPPVVAIKKIIIYAKFS